MVDEDRYCIDILEQISAATRALQSVALQSVSYTHLDVYKRQSYATTKGLKVGGTLTINSKAYKRCV